MLITCTPDDVVSLDQIPNQLLNVFRSSINYLCRTFVGVPAKSKGIVSNFFDGSSNAYGILGVGI